MCWGCCIVCSASLITVCCRGCLVVCLGFYCALALRPLDCVVEVFVDEQLLFLQYCFFYLYLQILCFHSTISHRICILYYLLASGYVCGILYLYVLFCFLH